MLPNFLILYCLQGQGSIKQGNREAWFEPGSTCLLRPFEVYDSFNVISQTGRESFDYIYIYFDIHPYSARGNFKAHSANLGNDLFGKEWNQCLKPYFNELSQQGRLGNIKTIETTLILQTIVRHFIVHSYCSRQGFTVEASASNCLRESEIVDQAFTYVEEHLEEPLKIQVLAKNIGASCKTLNRAFNLIFKSTPLQCLTHFKMVHSIALMERGLTVQEAAASVGYASPFYFSRSFKKIMGQCPTVYCNLF
jgi:AraC-like DNA-binding protein